jgi:hypothetical protein
MRGSKTAPSRLCALSQRSRIYPTSPDLRCRTRASPSSVRERAQWSAHELEWVRGCRGYPSPIIAGGNTEQPSPARGEGTIRATEIAARLNPRRGLEISRCQTAHLVPAPALLHPGFASLLHSPLRGVGGAPTGAFLLSLSRRQARVWAARVTRGSRRAKPRPTRSPFGAPPWRSPATSRSVFGSFPETPSTSGMRTLYYGRIT